MDSFSVDCDAVEGVATQIGDQISPLVTAANAGTAGIAASACGANTGFLTSTTLIALCATQFVEACTKLGEESTEHADLLRQMANEYRTRDHQLGEPFRQLATRDGS